MSRSKRRAAVWLWIVAIATVALGSLIGAPLQAQSGYQIVVNNSTDVTTLSREDVSQLLLKGLTQWPNGAPVVPVDLAQDSPTRARMSEAIHGRNVAAIVALWQRQLFSGRAVPPVEKANDGEVLQFVAATPGAIGYVSSDAQLVPGVHAVLLTAAAAAGTNDAIFDAAAVEEPPSKVSAPAIRYPAGLQRQRVEGSVMLEFVIDAKGRAESETIHVVQTSHDDFVAPARDLVLRSVYRPGRVHGRAVRVRVQQLIQFQLGDGE